MIIRALAATAVLFAPLAAAAQDATPTQSPLPWTLPPGNSVTPPPVVLPATPEPTLQAAPTPTPRRTARPQPTATPAPTPTATPRARAAPVPTASAEPASPAAATPEAAPVVVPEPTPEAIPAPTPEAAPEPAVTVGDLATVAPEAEGESRGSLFGILLAVVVVAALAALLFWRRRRPEEEVETEVEAAPPPAPVADPLPDAESQPVASGTVDATPTPPQFLNRPTPALADTPAQPSFLTRPNPAQPGSEPEGLVVSTAFRRPAAAPPAAPASAAERAPLDFTFLPMAMGTEGDKAVVRFELGASNPADFAVPELRFAAGLFGASPQQDAEIERFFAEMPAHSQLQPFAVGAGESRKVEATVSLPLANLPALTAGERRFFVPVMAIDARYRWADGREARTRVAFVVGRQIQGSEKLAPVFLDRGDRMVDRLEARLHGEVRRD